MISHYASAVCCPKENLRLSNLRYCCRASQKRKTKYPFDAARAITNRNINSQGRSGRTGSPSSELTCWRSSILDFAGVAFVCGADRVSVWPGRPGEADTGALGVPPPKAADRGPTCQDPGDKGGATLTGPPASGIAEDPADDVAPADITGLAGPPGKAAGGLVPATGNTCGSCSLPNVILKWLGRHAWASRGTSMPIGSPGPNAPSVAGLI